MRMSVSITRGEKLVDDAALNEAAATIGCKLKASTVEFHKQLALSLRTKRPISVKRQEDILNLRTLNPAVDDDFEALATLEENISSFFKQPSKEAAELQKDAIAQLSFQDEWFKCLNDVPFILTIIALFKIWFVPATAILVPLFMWLMPYIFLKYLFNLPIKQNEYFDILRHLWSGSAPSPPYGFSDSGLPAVPSLWTPRSIFQGIIFIGSFAQSLIQPIMNAMHLYKTDKQFMSIGTSILEICTRGRRVAELLRMPVSPLISTFDGLDARQAFCLVQDQPERIRQIFLSIGRLEVLWRIAQHDSFHPCSLIDSDGSSFILEGVRDISIKDAITSTIHLEGTHAVITGPNGGGKSSALRAILQSVLLGHAYGMVPATRAEIPRFHWIASGLQLRDTPGVLSMFETEVYFASKTLAASASTVSAGPGLVLFDELFHSTNPPDADRTAELFLQAVWNRKNIYSIVSTHNFGLIERAPKTVMALCCPATEKGNGDIEYSFTVKPGICKVSSVKKVWERFGLSSEGLPRPQGGLEILPVKKKPNE
jgi:hypothetical protein